LIAGLFGTDPGETGRAVKINGQPLNVRYWQPTLIACDLPQTGADAAGTVVVEVGGGNAPRRSNEVNLTQWEGTLTYQRDDAGSLNVAMEINVRFRADIHAFRDLPHEQPFETTVLFSFMEESSVKVTTGGSYVETTGPCTDTFSFTKEIDLPWPGEEDSPGGTWSYFGSVDSQSHTLQLDVCLVAGYEVGTWVRSGTDQCPRYSLVLAATMEIEHCLFDDLVGVTAFRMQMGSDYDVPEDNRGPCTAPSLVADLAANAPSAQVTMHWDAMTSTYPPDPDAAR
jgi:hypothetical protein